MGWWPSTLPLRIVLLLAQLHNRISELAERVVGGGRATTQQSAGDDIPRGATTAVLVNASAFEHLQRRALSAGDDSQLFTFTHPAAKIIPGNFIHTQTQTAAGRKRHHSKEAQLLMH